MKVQRSIHKDCWNLNEACRLYQYQFSWFWNCNTVKQDITNGASLAKSTGAFSVLLVQLPLVYNYFKIIFLNSTQHNFQFFKFSIFFKCPLIQKVLQTCYNQTSILITFLLLSISCLCVVFVSWGFPNTAWIADSFQ